MHMKKVISSAKKMQKKKLTVSTKRVSRLHTLPTKASAVTNRFNLSRTDTVPVEKVYKAVQLPVNFSARVTAFVLVSFFLLVPVADAYAAEVAFNATAASVADIQPTLPVDAPIATTSASIPNPVVIVNDVATTTQLPPVVVDTATSSATSSPVGSIATGTGSVPSIPTASTSSATTSCA